jgi:hypothetical protein
MGDGGGARGGYGSGNAANPGNRGETPAAPGQAPAMGRLVANGNAGNPGNGGGNTGGSEPGTAMAITDDASVMTRRPSSFT